MDGRTNMILNEGVPLNARLPTTNVIVNGKHARVQQNGTVLQIKPEGHSSEVIEINTTLKVPPTKKYKVWLTINVCLGIAALIFTFCVGYFFWGQLASMRFEIDNLKSQLDKVKSDSLNKSQNTAKQEFLVSNLDIDNNKQLITENYIRGKFKINHNDVPKPTDRQPETVTESVTKPQAGQLPQTGTMVVQFYGKLGDVNLGTNSTIGPWLRDLDVSSESSEEIIKLDPSSNYITVSEGGLYLVYAQVVYITNSPSCYLVWARQHGNVPRLVTSCTTADVSIKRHTTHSQLSCSVHTVAKLLAGDTINLSQREPNRTISFKQGYTYFGLVKIG